MSRACSVCGHPERSAIDAALVAGTPYRSIAKQFALSEAAMQRHKAHIPAAIAKSQEAREEAQALDVVKQLAAINGVMWAILEDARATRDPETMMKASDRILRQLELQAKLLGDLDDRPQINVLVSPKWIEARTVIVRALEPYQEARLAVAAALRSLEGGKHA